MSRCKHEALHIEELGEWTTYHDREKDGAWSHCHLPGPYRNTLYVQCRLCGKEWTYTRRNAPKWLKKYLEEIF
jgi:hypothetical protein